MSDYDSIAVDNDLYFYYKEETTRETLKRGKNDLRMQATTKEADKTIGPRSFVTKWHNNGNKIERTESGSRYTTDFKIKVTDICVTENLTIMRAMERFNISHACLKNWFCIYKVRERRMEYLRDETEKLVAQGFKIADIAQKLGVSRRAIINYKNGR